MKQFLFRNRLLLGVLIATFTSGCVAPHIGQIDSEPQVRSLDTPTRQTTESAATAPGMIVHIDPQTGQIIIPPSVPSSGQVPQLPADTAKQPLPQLQETLSPVPGGGIVIQLDERFRTPLTATLDADSKVRFEHKPLVSGVNDKE
jgi:hypothetical protein